MKILDNNLNFIVNLDNILDAKIKQGINKEYNLEFTAILDSTAKNYINHNYIVEADENYFDIVTIPRLKSIIIPSSLIAGVPMMPAILMPVDCKMDSLITVKSDDMNWLTVLSFTIIGT